MAASRYAPHLGGIETVVAELARRLLSAGDVVVVVTHRHPAGLPAAEVLDGVDVRRVTFDAPARGVRPVLRFLRGTVTTRAALARLPRPDVVNVHGASSQTLHVARFAAARGIPLVLTTHGEITSDVHQIYAGSTYMRFAFRYAARRAEAVTAPSRHALRDAARLAPSTEAKGRVLPNGVDLSQWRRCGPPRLTHRVLAWGRLEPQKGFDRLIAVWPLVRAQVPDAELRIAGDGGERERLAAAGGDGVVLLGRMDRAGLLRELGDAQLAAVPSRLEAFGMSALEALAAGRQVLHSGVPALTDVVGGHGWAVPHDDPSRLTAGVVQALRSPPREVPVSAVGAYDWTAVTDSYRALYREVVRPGR